MNAASVLRSKATAIVGAGVLGAGLLGSVALAAIPATTAADPAISQSADAARGTRLKTLLDALVAKNVITQAQEDAIISALMADRTAAPKLREFVGDVMKESVSYLGLPADQVTQQLRAGKSLGVIANATAGKSRDGLLADLDAKAKTRIDAAVAAGTITQAQADQLTTKVDDGIVKVVDHTGGPRPTATN